MKHGHYDGLVKEYPEDREIKRDPRPLIAKCADGPCKRKDKIKNVCVSTVMCPDCGWALFWERYDKDDKRRVKNLVISNSRRGYGEL